MSRYEKKIYQIKIVSAKPGIWYANKIGKKYDAEISDWGDGGFLIGGTHFIRWEDIEIVSESVVEKYYQKQKV